LSPSTRSRASQDSESEQTAAVVSWDSGVFHGGAVLSDTDKEQAQLAVYETLVRLSLSLPISLASTEKDLDEREQESLTMIRRALLKSSDQRLHSLYFSQLLQSEKGIRMFLQINSPFVEEYLLCQDVNLLYNYYRYFPCSFCSFHRKSLMCCCLLVPVRMIAMPSQLKHLT
jgi:hypothetical protein